MAISAARVTRFGLSGYMTRPYGSFAGKTATEGVAITPFEGLRVNVGRLMR